MDTNEPNLLTIRVNLNNDKKQKKKSLFDKYEFTSNLEEKEKSGKLCKIIHDKSRKKRKKY